MSKYFVYILQSKKDKSLYIGYSTNLKKRVQSHNRGNSVATKYKAPFQLIYCEAFLDKKDAKTREKYLKSGWGRRSINKLLRNYLAVQKRP